MNKPDQVFIWHCNSEVPDIYHGFSTAFAGSKGGIQIRVYDPDEDDPSTVIRDEIIPNAVKQSHTVVMLLTGKERLDREFVRLLESIANAPHRVVVGLVFLVPAGKDWWRQNIEPKIESLSSQFIDPIEIWSNELEPAILTGDDKDSACVRRVEGLRKRVEAKVRELDVTTGTPAAIEGQGAKGRRVILLSGAGSANASLEKELIGALAALPPAGIAPISWSGHWQEPSSQAAYSDFLKQPVLFVRIIGDASYTEVNDADFRRDIRTAIGLTDIDYGAHWGAVMKSSRLDWAPNARKGASSEGSTQGNRKNSNSAVRAGISARNLALEIGRYLGVVKPAPPRVGYITISMSPCRAKLVPDAESFESNLKSELREALKDALRDRVDPSEPEVRSYLDDYDLMIEKEIQSGRIPIILADDLASSAQRPDIEQVLKQWEARIRIAAVRASRTTQIIKGALIYFNAAEFEGLAKFPNDEFRSWFPLVVNESGTIARSQLQAMISEVSRAFPDAA